MFAGVGDGVGPADTDADGELPTLVASAGAPFALLRKMMAAISAPMSSAPEASAKGIRCGAGVGFRSGTVEILPQPACRAARVVGDDEVRAGTTDCGEGLENRGALVERALRGCRVQHRVFPAHAVRPDRDGPSG